MKIKSATFFCDEASDGKGGGGGDKSLLGGGGGTITDWRTSLPEDIRGEALFASVKAKDATEALGIIAKQHVHAQKLIGVDKIAKPNAKWGEKEWGEFNRSLGVPETHDKYELPDVKLAEGLKLDDTKVGKFKQVFHKLGLRPDQVKGVMQAYLEDLNGDFTGRLEGNKLAMSQATTALKGEFGDKYDSKLDIAKSVLRKFGSDTLLAKLESSGLANDPEVVKLFVKLGEGMLEDKAGGGGDDLLIKSSTAATQEINKLKGDAEFQKALTGQYAPGHKEAVAKWLQLHEEAAATKE